MWTRKLPKESRKMKKMMILLVVLLIGAAASSCGVSTRATRKINQVEIGMTKAQIRHLLGTPLFKNADKTCEEWGYRKMVGDVAGPEEMLFIVNFDNNGKVVAYNSVKTHPHYHPY